MKLFKKMKDGGAESTVTGYWLIEAKSLFSIVLLKFEGKSREAFHSHAFNSVSWVLKGMLLEARIVAPRKMRMTAYSPSLHPIITTRSNMHQVNSHGTTWVLSFRGPWASRWQEQRPLEGNRIVTLTHGRKEVA